MRQVTIEGRLVLTPTYARRRAESITRLPQPGPISLTATRRKAPSSAMEKVDTVPSAALETNASEGMLLILVPTHAAPLLSRHSRSVQRPATTRVPPAGPFGRPSAAARPRG